MNHTSLSKIKNVFESFNSCENWSIQLMNIRNSQRTGTGYSCRGITISPSQRIRELIGEIAAIYLGDGKKSLRSFKEVRAYDGTADSFTIYKLDMNNTLVSDEYANFIRTIANPDVEADPFEYTSAYLLKGDVTINGESTPVKMVSMQNPTTTLKHKFMCKEGTFTELTEKVLSLRPTMDVIMIGDVIYFLTLAGENLFNMERSYKAACHQKVEVIEQADIVSDIEAFKAIAEHGHNPRRFIAFNESKLIALKSKKKRIEISKQFAIPMDASGEKFDSTVDGAAEKIVKLLCDKGMIDPFDRTAMEVDSARRWK